jgi:hypothetical protein
MVLSTCRPAEEAAVETASRWVEVKSGDAIHGQLV